MCDKGGVRVKLPHECIGYPRKYVKYSCGESQMHILVFDDNLPVFGFLSTPKPPKKPQFSTYNNLNYLKMSAPPKKTQYSTSDIFIVVPAKYGRFFFQPKEMKMPTMT
jgi:hypothetical protein